MLPDVRSLWGRVERLPQPVALAVARVIGARTLAESLDAVVKAAEVVTRYTAVVSLASYGARQTGPTHEEVVPLELAGPLSYGHFLTVAQTIARRVEEHPLRADLRRAFLPPGKNKGAGPANGALTRLLTLRNVEGHDLRHVDLAKATAHYRAAVTPLDELVIALDALSPLLNHRLLVIGEQHISRKQITAVCYFLLGRAQPFPEEIQVATDVGHLSMPYLETPWGLLCLGPGMLWDLVESQREFGIYFVDKVHEERVLYKSMSDGTILEGEPELRAGLHGWLVGATTALEAVSLGSELEPIASAASTDLTLMQHSDFEQAEAFAVPDPEPEADVVARPVVEGDSVAEPNPAAAMASTEGAIGRIDWESIRAYLVRPGHVELLEQLVEAVRVHRPTIGGAMSDRHIAFTDARRDLFAVVRRQAHLQIVLRLDPELAEGSSDMRDLRGIRHWGSGELEFRLAESSQVEHLAELIEQSTPGAANVGATGMHAEGERLDAGFLIDLLARQDKTVDDVATATGRTTRAIRSDLAFHEIESLARDARVKGTVADGEQVHRYEGGEDVGEIAAELRVRQKAALHALVSAGAVLRPPDSARIGHRQATIPRSELEKLFIREKRPPEEIGKKFNVSRQRVHQILERYGMPTTVDRRIDPATLISEPRLRHLYVTQGLSMAAIVGRTDLQLSQVAELVDRWELVRPRVHERHGLTKELLEETYVRDHKGVPAIAAELGVPRQAVAAALAHHGIPMRSRSETLGRGAHEILTPQFLSERLGAGVSPADIAREVNTSSYIVERQLVRTGLKDEREPNHLFDEVLSLEALQRDYLDTDLSLAEYAAQIDAPQSEIRLRLNNAGIDVPRRANSKRDLYPSARSVRAAEMAGRPDSFSLDDAELARLYVVEGRSTADIAELVDRSASDVVRALCATGITVRLGFGDVLSKPFLVRRYIDERATAVDIAKEVGTTPATVGKALGLHSIAIRDRSQARAGRRRPELDQLTEDRLRNECVDRGRSATSVAKELGVTPADVLTALRSFGLPTRAASGGQAQAKRLRSTLTRAYLQSAVEQGRTATDIAGELDSKPAIVQRYAEQAGVVLELGGGGPRVASTSIGKIAYLTEVIEIVRPALARAGLVGVHMHPNGDYATVRFPPGSGLEVGRGHLVIKTTRSKASVGLHVYGFDTRAQNAAALEVLRRRYASVIDGALPCPIETWHGGADGALRDIAQTSLDDAGYSSGDPARAAAWAEQVCIAWAMVVASDPIADLAAEVANVPDVPTGSGR